MHGYMKMNTIDLNGQLYTLNNCECVGMCSL